MKDKNILRVTALLLVAGMLLSLCACTANNEARATLRASKTVATAGDYDVPYEKLYFLAMNQIADMKAVYGEAVFGDPAKVAELEQFVFDNLFEYTEAMILIGEEYDLDISEGEIAAGVQSTVDTMIENNFEGDWDNYVDMLDARYMTDRYFRTYIGVSEYLTDAIVQEMRKRGDIDDSETAARNVLYGKDFVHVYQVLIDPIASRLSDEEAKAKAEALRATVVAAEGADARFEAMRQAIQSSLAIDDGNGLYFARGQMEPEFEDVAFALAAQGDFEVSEVFATADGYRFLMSAPKDVDYIEAHFDELKEGIYYVEANRRATEILNSTEVKLTKYGESLDLLDLPPIRAEGGEWVNTVIVLGSIVLAGVLVFLMVKFLPDKKDSKKKGKAKALKK